MARDRATWARVRCRRASGQGRRPPPLEQRRQKRRRSPAPADRRPQPGETNCSRPPAPATSSQVTGVETAGTDRGPHRVRSGRGLAGRVLAPVDEHPSPAADARHPVHHQRGRALSASMASVFAYSDTRSDDDPRTPASRCSPSPRTSWRTCLDPVRRQPLPQPRRDLAAVHDGRGRSEVEVEHQPVGLVDGPRPLVRVELGHRVRRPASGTPGPAPAPSASAPPTGAPRPW